MKDTWNDRYSQPAYAYGTEPNQYFKAQLEKLSPRKILFAAEGEGRNAVYAASRGWSVSAFDTSSEGQKKALRLAESKGVEIDYQVGEIQSMDYEAGQFDAIGLIFAHFQADVRSFYHRQLDSLLRVGGVIILEAFSKNNLAHSMKNVRIGGPKDAALLFSIEEVRSDFPNYAIEELSEVETELSEGLYHNGLGSVIRFVGRKQFTH